VINEHAFHRVGLAVDINNTGPFLIQDPKKPKDKKAKILTAAGQQLVRSMSKFGGKLYPEPTIHFGFQGHN
jgi:hypothetical protein